MADAETEAEWAKLREVDRARKKAAASLESRNDKTAQAYLDPKNTKVKGFSRDRDVIMVSVEKFANSSIVFVIAGLVLSLVGGMGGIVANVNQLGMAGTIISSLPQLLGIICLGIAVVSAITGIIGSLWFLRKYQAKLSYAFYSSIATLIIFGLYLFLKYIR